MRKISFSPPDITKADIKAVSDVLRSGWITSGPVGETLCRHLCAYTGARGAVVLNSATAGLFLALRAFGIGEGDEVITTPYTFAATANAILHTGAKPIFADHGSFFISPEAIAQKLSAKTKAVIPVDFGGGLCNYQAISDILKNHPIKPSSDFQQALTRPLLLADSAHSLGAQSNLPDIRVYSFHAVKNLTTAEGGALALHHMGGLEEDFLKKVSLYALHGQDKSARDKFLAGNWEYDIALPGYKCNMPDVLAALGLSQLKRYQSTILPHRRALFDAYDAAFSANTLSAVPFTLPDLGEGHSAHLYPLRIETYTQSQRDTLIKKLGAEGIAANVHYKPLTLMSASPHYGSQTCPKIEALWQNEISLPIHSKMSSEDALYIADMLKKML